MYIGFFMLLQELRAPCGLKLWNMPSRFKVIEWSWRFGRRWMMKKNMGKLREPPRWTEVAQEPSNLISYQWLIFQCIPGSDFHFRLSHVTRKHQQLDVHRRNCECLTTHHLMGERIIVNSNNCQTYTSHKHIFFEQNRMIYVYLCVYIHIHLHYINISGFSYFSIQS